ncbi:hypothetical protein PsYK624_083560 [Phanerochaete sordida]|uniref:Uncharacterized protein n=1 Tax=Phanerochaete sordida TaxID=48140 RepID=A0A9P3LF45_9APHY|nr:hypothetical protein PsYK624_083560 [Phanerochaete sordida]
MIILDEDEEQFPKIASPPPVHPVVRRPGTPTPSLPDYETSQEQEQLKTTVKPGKRRIRRKWIVYGLIAYFVVTVAIGVPLIVLKTRHDGQSYKSPSMLYPSQPSWSNSSSIPGFNLGETPVCVDSATACNSWVFKDKWQNGIMQAHLEYYLPVTSTIFVQSNVSCLPSKVGPITGSLTVGFNPDLSTNQAAVKVLMSYTGTDIREQTSVCLMNLAGSDGLYIYVPPNLTAPDHLDFNITFLFPKPNGTSPMYIENFLTSLPYFSQYIGALSPRITFGNVGLIGMRSNITIASMEAEALLIKSPYSDIGGMLNITANGNDDDDNDDDTKS